MSIVSHAHTPEVKGILEMPGLQARLAKDGTDDDIKLAFLGVNDKTARLKDLIRKGIESEQEAFIFDGDDLIEPTECVIAVIGSHRTTHRL